MELRPTLAFGDLLRSYRAAAGLTQEELAERAGVSVRTIGDIERAVSGVPHRDTVGLLSQALELSGDARTAFEASARRRAATQSPALGGARTQSESSAPASPPLVGRAQEVALLQRHLAGNGPPLLLLAGEPGIGKSRLLAATMRDATSRGWSVLEGGCQRRGSQEPFAPLVGAIASFLRGCTPATSRGYLRGCAWLVRLLPELVGTIGEGLPGWVLAPDQERRLMFEATARLLSNVARWDGPEADSGVLLVLDDLQWAGSDAFELLTSLMQVQSPGDHPWVRIVGAYRDTEVQPNDVLGVALADWAHAELVTHHTLPPLTSKECEHLLEALVAEEDSHGVTASGPAASREQVLQRAGGVPFFVVSYAHALSRGGIAGVADAVPWDVAQGVRQRVAALPEAARTLLTAAAVVGRASEPAVLSAVAARPEEEVLIGLDAACRARLLMDMGDTYQFTHDVIREVVEADMGSARRAALHRHAGQAIEALHRERLSEQYETLAHHYVRGEAWDQALEYLTHSGDKATRAGAIREALNFYDQALATCARLGAPAQSSASVVAEKRGFVYFDSGDFDNAVKDFGRMRAAASLVDDRRRQGLALAYGGMAAYYGHDFEAAEDMLRDALQVASEGFNDVRLFASIQLSSLFMVTGRHREAAPLLRSAEALALVVDDPLSRSWWAITGSEVFHWSGRYNDALAFLERWRGAVTASNQLLMLLWTKWETALACGGKGDYNTALQLLDEVITTCTDTGESFIRARALNTAGWLHCELEDHQRALELNGESLALADAIETADTEISSNARLNLGDSYLAVGQLAEAEALFQAVEQIVRTPRPHDRWMLWRYRQHLFHSYGSLWLARGDLETALCYADECLRAGEETDSPKNIVKARRLRGEVFLARGELTVAAAELERALEVARRIGNPPQLWRTLAAVAAVRQAAKQNAAAGDAYHEALAVIEAVASNLRDERLKATFLSSSHIEHIRQLSDSALAVAG